MITLFLILSTCAFIAYFYAIWLWYLWIIPLLLCISFFVFSLWWLLQKGRANSLFNDYWLFFAWIVILVWLFLILQFFWALAIPSFLFLLIINILLLIWSYIFKYEDGKIVWHIWFWFVYLALLIYVGIVFWAQDCFNIFWIIWCLYLWIVAFITCILRLWYEVDKNMYYLLFVLFWWAIMILLFKLTSNIYIFLIEMCICLAWLYFLIDYILRNKPPTQTQVKEISVRRILAWERVLQKIPQHNNFSQIVYDFVQNMPQIVKYVLEFANTLVIIILIYLYFRNALSLKWSMEQLFYWIIMILFIVNVFLLKKIDYTSIVQRLFTYLVINFAIYISLFAAFSGDVWNIVIWWIAWNLISSVVVFHVHKTKLGQYLRKVDYLFWIFATILAMIVNVILLINTSLSAKLLFPIILLYVWIQGMLLYYSLRFVHKIKEEEVVVW